MPSAPNTAYNSVRDPARAKPTAVPKNGAEQGVAKIVAHDIGLDCDSIAASLLHDVVEDTKLTIKDINKAVGNNIGKIVDGLTKISILRKNKDYSIQAENYRRMLLTLHNDIRVILIKIADRLHNMRTIEHLDNIKMEKIASESLYILSLIHI